ncbi:tryptophan dimethylallyltransferase family protein [Amycolatopsis sp.]|uniref:tryptophan dimethylallyltransferase family protein n=1 Tax=Amycolatopsis sp. TaxID=37632 RepID=UPI002B5AD1D0|nr:tryptophan dimethylallyltransferase family protein [Amycolatopsis sp.]HVV08920.1 tryptophan dimethylallyltransferase family protein [Amycolatopsis sp.]
MNVADVTLYDHARKQLRDLCGVAGFAPPRDASDDLLAQLLGSAATQRLSDTPRYLSDVADDGTPLEFSLAFDAAGGQAVRILGETCAENPGLAANAQAGLGVFRNLARSLGSPLDRLEAVADLFLPADPVGLFSLWYSLILRPDAAPKLKVYLNPAVRGPGRDRDLVRKGLARLGLADAYESISEYALRRGERDRFSFFALDLDDSPLSRVKLYVSHDSARPADVEHAAAAVADVDSLQVRRFCHLLGGMEGPFTGRPLISSYSFVEATSAVPGNYSLYLPIRDYVPDDEAARARVLDFLAQSEFEQPELDKALRAVSSRPLHEGVGLIAHVSLRLGGFGTGTTVYLSSEAYGVTRPRGAAVAGSTETQKPRGAA